jgi:uncharacterized Zn-finger protein
MMERIFWVSCPGCGETFYANHREMRTAGVDLFCPYCHARFAVTDSVITDERAKTPTG